MKLFTWLENYFATFNFFFKQMSPFFYVYKVIVSISLLFYYFAFISFLKEQILHFHFFPLIYMIMSRPKPKFDGR